MSIRAVSSGPERVRLMEEEESRASEDSPSESLLAAVRLAMIPGVGPKTRQTLLSEFGTADAVLDAPSWRLTSVDGVGRTLSERIASANERIDAPAEIDLCRQHGVTILRHGQEGYPRLLSEIHDPPGVLFVLGSIEPRDDLALSIVGSRHCTNYGRSQAKRLAAELSRMGFTIVSGLARGIDAAAHQGAMDAGGRTIAVLGSGVLNIYPPDHARLAEDVTANGALISESPPRRQPISGTFPQRNRLITGMSLGVIVVEATERSGALISARHAMEQGREVFAVPGRIDWRQSRGCHRLIRDGAKLVETVDDVLEELGPLTAATTDSEQQVVYHPAELQLNPQERAVLALIDEGLTSIDEIVAGSGLPVPQVLSTISVLEMSRLIRRVSGNQVARNS